MQPAQSNIAQMAAQAGVRYAHQPAFTCLGKTLRFRQLAVLSDGFACWLRQEAGIQPGDRVAIMLPNLLQYPVVALGALKAQAVVVNINPLYTPQELGRLLQDSGATVMVVLANVAHTLAAVPVTTAVRHIVLTEVGDLLGKLAGPLTNFTVRHIKQLIKPFRLANTISFPKVLRQGEILRKRLPALSTDFSPDRLAVLQYTGGTTGIVKGAMLSHRNLLSNVDQLIVTMGSDCPGPQAVMVAPLPLYHIYAFSLNFLLAQQLGHHVLLIPDPRDCRTMVKAMARLTVQGFIGINTLYKNLLQHPGFRQLDFSALRIASSGGMALSAEVSDQWQALTGKPILEGYGLTECSPMVSCNTYGHYRRHTAGKVAAGTQLRLVKADGGAAAPLEAGEILVRGPQVMRGYWNNAAETALVLDEAGWLRTGDIGVLDADGFLQIVDRIKDVIVVSGFNVYPKEIEDHALLHPDICEACAVASGDELAPRIKLFVVSSNPALTADELKQHCRTGLAAYKVPKDIEFRSALPKSSLGKVLRRELRE